MNETIYQAITDRIIALLKENVVPWNQPWTASQLPVQNLVSRKPYNGINVFLLRSLQYSSSYFVTFKQAKELNGFVNKGEKGCPVIFWKWVEIENKETGKPEKVPFLRQYFVFNAVAQCTGLKVPSITQPVREHSPIEAAQKIIDEMPLKPEIRHGFAQAFYSPVEDYVGLPAPGHFRTPEDYYATSYHELAHASGHSSRLNRKGLSGSDGQWSAYGSNRYAKEELVSEMCSALLCNEAGLIERTIDNSAAYISGWLQRLRNDAKLVVQAAAQAQKAADFILGKTQTSHETEGN